MYIATIILFLFVCPLACVIAEALHLHQTITSLALIGKWWTFWAVGIRLFLAGVRQVTQPAFTAQSIFKIQDPAALPLVREVGFSNLSLGILGIATLFRPGWTVPAAIVAAGLYYGLAGLGHIASQHRNAKEYTAMLTDAFAAIVLLGFALKTTL